MKIKLLSDRVVGGKKLKKGVVEVSDADAKFLVNSGKAEKVEGAKKADKK